MMRTALVAMLAALASATLAAPVEVNKATRAEIESVPGIGPSIAENILDERGKATFDDWQDLIARVKGVGAASAAKLSAAGLTVNGAPYRGSKPAKAKSSEASRKD